MSAYVNESKHYEDVQIGDAWRSPGRTITETDVVHFAGLTGDFNPLHIDQAYARSSPFGRPIAHGLLGLSLVAGLGSNSPPMCTAALVRIVDWKFLHPLFIGETVAVETEVLDKQLHGRRHGLIVWQRQLLSVEKGLVLQQGVYETLVRTKADKSAA